MALWGIHAGKTGGAEKLFLEKNVVALGWKDIGDLTGLPRDRDAFKARMLAAYGDTHKPGMIPVSAGQLFRFIHEMAPGDVVLYPVKGDHLVRVGTVEGPYVYSTDLDATYPHRRTVRWITTIPKASFSTDAMNELGSALSFFSVRNNADEIRGV